MTDREAVFVVLAPVGVVSHFGRIAEGAGLKFRAIPVQGGSSSAGATVDADDPSMAPLLLRLDRTAQVLDCSESTVKRLVKAGSLPTVKVNGSTRVRVADLERFVEALGDGDRPGEPS